MNWNPTAPREAERLRPAPHETADEQRPQLRPCRAMWLDSRGDVQELRFLIPALALFEGAFCAFARGTLVETNNGPVAIEDLLPGDTVLTADGAAQPVTWIGTTTLVPPGASSEARSVPLFRILPDAFGMARPLSHMVAGPSARIPGQSGRVLTPVSAYEDGVQVTRLSPPSPIEMFHLCLPRHALLRMGGLEFESFHPGHGALRDMGPAMRDLYLKLFPHIDHITDFGAMVLPREAMDHLGGVTAA